MYRLTYSSPESDAPPILLELIFIQKLTDDRTNQVAQKCPAASRETDEAAIVAPMLLRLQFKRIYHGRR